MPNWCEIEITMEGDSDVLAMMNNIMQSGADDPTDGKGQPMSLFPMPEVLRGTRSPAPSGDYDADGRFMKLVADPTLGHWTPERYEADKAEHYALIERAELAKAETGYSDWYSWTDAEWGTKWSVDVFSYKHSDDSISVTGQTAWSPPFPLLQKISEKFGVKISMTYCEPSMDFIGASAIIEGEIFDSCGSFSEHLPEDFDFDSDDAWEIESDIRERIRSAHENHAWDLATA